MLRRGSAVSVLSKCPWCTSDTSLDKDWVIRPGSGSRQSRNLLVDGNKLEIWYFFPPHFKQTTNSPSLRKASRSNSRPLFSNYLQNDVMSVRLCWSSFRKKTNCILLAPFKKFHFKYLVRQLVGSSLNSENCKIVGMSNKFFNRQFYKVKSELQNFSDIIWAA